MVQKKKAGGGQKKYLCMRINSQCGQSKYATDIVEYLNQILLPGLNQRILHLVSLWSESFWAHYCQMVILTW